MKNMLMLIFVFCGIMLQYACNDRNVRKHPSPYDFQDAGKSAGDLLRSDRYKSLEIKVQYMAGRKLDQASIDTVVEFLEQVCDKPGGISFSQELIDISTDTSTLEQVIASEQLHRKTYTGSNTIVLYVLITNGYSDNSHIAAYTYYNTSVVIFGKVIQDNIERIGKVHMETFLLLHELGHIMGLVNMGTPMQVPHEDSIYTRHCTNPACTMNYGSVSTHLDSACLNDLRALRESRISPAVPSIAYWH